MEVWEGFAGLEALVSGGEPAGRLFVDGLGDAAAETE
jgi:hypothetical protein